MIYIVWLYSTIMKAKILVILGLFLAVALSGCIFSQTTCGNGQCDNNETQQSCAADCTTPVITTPECTADSDCNAAGSPQMVCKGNAVYESTPTAVCEAEGTTFAKCETSWQDTLVEDCAGTCSDGSCVSSSACSTDADCGTDGLVGGTSCDYSEPGLYTQFFNSTNLSNFALSRIDGNISFWWNKNAPAAGVNASGFSATFSGKIVMPQNKIYTFYLQSGRGARLYIDGKLVIDDWLVHTNLISTSSERHYAAGQYDININYYNEVSDAVLELSWRYGSVSRSPVPTGSFLHAATFQNYRTYACTNPSTPEASCSYADEKRKLSDCASCSGNACGG
jgi:hypothetical protein